MNNSTASSETSRQAAQLHQDMISLFERELVLEILLVVGQEMELRENAQYNLLMMEILHHIVKTQDPTIIARHSHSKAAKDDTKPSTLTYDSIFELAAVQFDQSPMLTLPVHFDGQS